MTQYALSDNNHNLKKYKNRNNIMAHILVVDDSKTEVKFVTLILEKQGYQVSTAFNGEEGIEKAKALKPDLILMDVIMPGKLNGYQATRQMSSCPETKSIPVIIVSALKTDNDKAWGLMMGAKGYLGKPFKQEELLEEVENFLKKGISFLK